MDKLLVEVFLMSKKITIQKASELLGVTVKTLKIWDNDNILKPTYRTPAVIEGMI